MTCPDCLIADANPRTGHFSAGCQECEARAIARDYGGKEGHVIQAVMRRVWPSESDYRAGRVKVWNWIKRLEKI